MLPLSWNLRASKLLDIKVTGAPQWSRINYFLCMMGQPVFSSKPGVVC